MAQSQKRFGTISGVFITDVLTILGVIMYFRMGWIVGNGGLTGTLAIILLATSITFVTGLSVSAISTNIRVKTGGAYYMISRSLGAEIGGALGITLFFAQAISIAFYIIGFTLALQNFLPQVPLWILNSGVLLSLTLLAIINAELAIKAQYVVFGLIMLSLVSFFGGNLAFDQVPLWRGSFPEAGFWEVFAIYFPAVTGITAGLSLSGDLRDPEKNIPRGTLGAILFTLVIYLAVMVVFLFNIPVDDMIGRERIMEESALFPPLITAGILAATLSSALGSILGAPRTLQAVARDGIVPSFLGKGGGKAQEPRAAMVFSVVLAEGVLLMGNLDFVAPILTMFFLTTYGMINAIVTLEGILENPAYRPRFRVPWPLTLYGTLGSFAIMFLINKAATAAALAIVALIIYILTRRNMEARWGDLRKGVWGRVVEAGIRKYSRYADHPRHWRPRLAIMERDNRHQKELIDMAMAVAGSNNSVTHYSFIDGAPDQPASQEEARALFREMNHLLELSGYRRVYPRVIMTGGDARAPLAALQAGGLAQFGANTVISDFSVEDKSFVQHLRGLPGYEGIGMNVILYKGASDTEKIPRGRIDIWLSGFSGNTSFLLLIPYLILRHPEWKGSPVMLRMVVSDAAQKKKMELSLGTILRNTRLDMTLEITALDENTPALQEGADSSTSEAAMKPTGRGGWKDRVKGPGALLARLGQILTRNSREMKATEETRKRIFSIIREKSGDARLVVMGLKSPEIGKEEAYAKSMAPLLKELPPVLLVKSHQDISMFV